MGHISNDCCAICLVDFDAEDAEDCQQLGCGHYFHRSCIVQLCKFGIKSLCPLCRTADPQMKTVQEMFEDAVALYVRYQQRTDRSDDNDAGRCRELLSKVLQLDPENRDGALLLGYMCLHAIGGKADFSKAKQIYTMADAAGNCGGTVGLACMYEVGVGCSKNMRLARELYSKADSSGSLDGTMALARMYRRGLGGEKDDRKARELLAKADAADELDGTVELAQMLETGIGGEKDACIARNLYRKAHNGGNLKGSVGLGRMRKSGAGGVKREAMARKLFERLHAKGDFSGSTELAIMLRDGDGGDQDTVRARELLEQAVGARHFEALPHLADMYYKGIGGEVEMQKALELYRRLLHHKPDLAMIPDELMKELVAEQKYQAQPPGRRVLEQKSSIDSAFTCGSFRAVVKTLRSLEGSIVKMALVAVFVMMMVSVFTTGWQGKNMTKILVLLACAMVAKAFLMTSEGALTGTLAGYD